jgi:hypothetical protein
MTVFKIGMWGTSRAGKTTYLAMLYKEFLQDTQNWKTYTTDEARQFLERAYAQIYKEHIFPEKTVQTQNYQYHVTRVNDNRSFVLEFLDTAGELYEAYYQRNQRGQHVSVAQRDTRHKRTDKTPSEIFDYLKTCDGILFFIDPSWSGEHTHAQMIWQVLEDLWQYGRDNNVMEPPLIALIVTKVDASDDYWSQRQISWEQCYRIDPAQKSCVGCCPAYDQLKPPFMHNWLSPQPPERVRCFATSSIGRLDNDKLNIGEGYAWQREPTPTPTRTLSRSVPQLVYLNQVLAQRPTKATYNPNSINQPDAIQPFGLQAPIEWMINFDR